MTQIEFTRIEDEIYDSLVDTKYDSYEIVAILETIVGKKCSLYDNYIDDGCGDDEEDEYVMKSCFEFEGINLYVYIYYGDVTGLIGHIDVNYNDDFDDEEDEDEEIDE
jgi:hypothetical protein